MLRREHGTIFIAVGAAHLAGPDSVQMQLNKLGIQAARE
ncbi:MAG: TraB/GumN family protein [Rhodanobacter sp.]